MIYLLILVILLIISYLESNYRIKEGLTKKSFIFFTFLILTLTASLRYNLGQDYHTYLHIYKTPNAQLRFEFLFRWLNQGFNYFKLPYPYLFGISSFITILSVFIASKKYSEKMFLSIYLYFSIYYLYWVFSVVRQGISNSIILLSVSFIENKKLLQVSIITIIAYGFHQSGILLILFYFLNYIKFEKNSLLIFLIITIIIGQSGIFNHLIFLSPYLKSYSTHGNYTATNSILSFNVLNRFIVFFFIWLYSDQIKSKVKYGETLINVYFWGIFLYFLMGSMSGNIATRISGVVKTFDIFLLPAIITIETNSLKKKLVIIGIILYSVVMFLKYFIIHWDNYIPFKTFFNHL